MTKLFKSKWFWAVAIPVVLLGVYALVGFKLAPQIARDQAQAFVRNHYAREMTIGETRIHPFKLQAEVRDLALPDADGKPMLGFERLFVDFELASIWNRAFTFKEVTVAAPLLRAVVRPDGSLNLADLALPEEDPDAPTPSVWIQSLAVERGAIEYIDEARATPFSQSFHSVGFGLEDFRTTPEGGDFRFNARSQDDETFEWKGRFSLEPVIASRGEFRVGALQAPGLLDFLGEARPFTATQGTLDLAGSYSVSLGEQIKLGIELPSIELKGFSLRARGAETDWVAIPSLVVSGTSLALPAQTVAVQQVVLDGLTAQAWMSPDGSINLEQLFAFEPEPVPTPVEAPAEQPSAASVEPPAAAGEPEQPWTVTVGAVEVTNASIAFEDRMIAPVTRFDLAPVNVRLSDVSLDLARSLPVQLDAMINGQARFEAVGRLTPEPLAADLDIKLANARMQILQPYVLPVADLTITDGELEVAGHATLAPPEQDGPEITFAGNVSVDRFRTVDNALQQDLVNFRRVELSKLNYAMAPDSLRIDRVLVSQPYARVIISPEQVINIAAVLDPEGTAAALAERKAAAAAEAARTPAERRRLEKEREMEEKAAEEAAAARRKAGAVPPRPPAQPTPPDTFPIRIREVRIDGGRMNFSDFYVQPNFSADVQDLGGTVTGLSSAYDSRAKVQLAGKLDEFSPVSITGELQPFAFDHYTDLGLKFENISLPIFNPYSGPVAGFNIAKGKLTTDLHYRIEDRTLDAQHKIRVDQLEWGEATDTQGEATLPVKFATALLKDKNGVINLDVPVGGTLDDPTFRIGPIVWQIIKNIIVKAVTAPFALLGSLFAGAEEAQFVDFAPGEAVLDAATAERLGALAKSLIEKPELKLDVPIGALPEIDRPVLTERAYRVAVESAVVARFGKDRKKDAPAPTYEALEPKRRLEVLTALVKQQSGAEPRVPEAPAPPEGTSRADAKVLRETAAIEFLEKTARAGIVVPDTEVAELAEERALAIERALLADSGLESTRVFKVRDGKVSANEGKVRFELGLQ